MLQHSINSWTPPGIRIIPVGVFTQCEALPQASQNRLAFKALSQKAPSKKIAMLTAKAAIHAKLRSEARLTTYK